MGGGVGGRIKVDLDVPPDIGFAAPVHARQHVKEALLDRLGQDVGDGPADRVAMADQLHVSGVGELEHEIGAAKQRHETRRLLEQRREPFPLARGPPLGEHTLGRLDDDRDYARRFPVVARNRRIVEVHPHLLGPAVAMQGQLLVGIRQSPAGQPHLHHIIVEVGDLGPPLADLAAQKLRMPAPGKLRVSIVVDHDAVLAPQHDDRHGRAKQDSGRGFQALRPILDGAKRRVRPVEGRDQPPALAAA